MNDEDKGQLIFGLRQSIPVMLGYFPVGFALGVMASGTGINLGQMGVMSSFVYAGSAQFIGVDMMSIGANPAAIILTTFLVNLRHLLFSASLSPYFKHIHQKWIPFISFFVTDETFAVSITDAKKRVLSHYYYFGLYVTSYLCWVLSTMMGSAFGGLIPDTKALGFDFALPGMFLALLCLQIKDRKSIAIALISGTLSMIVLLTVPGHWNVIIAAITAAGLGVITEK